jgi:hypothetical protein
VSVSLTVQGVTYNLPENNDETWGVDTTNWMIAMTEALATVTITGDLAPPSGSAFAVQNNTSSATNITDLVFDSSETRAATIEYSVYRVKGSTELAEVGTLRIVYKTNASTWFIDRTYTGDDAGCVFTITSGGQVQYTSSNIATAGAYSGIMKWRARSLPV